MEGAYIANPSSSPTQNCYVGASKGARE